MKPRHNIVVNRTDDHIVLLIPEHELGRAHAILTEEEGYLVSTTIRRMLVAKDERRLTVGQVRTGLVAARVNHLSLPLEIILDDEDGTTTIDLTKDDALTLADMLWGANRTTTSFNAMVGLTGGVRFMAAGAKEIATPLADGLAGLHARMVRDVRRLSRGEAPEPKT